MNNLKNPHEWAKPSVLMGLLAAFVSFATLINSFIGSDKANALMLEKRITTLETTVSIMVIPSLQRIENNTKTH